MAILGKLKDTKGIVTEMSRTTAGKTRCRNTSLTGLRLSDIFVYIKSAQRATSPRFCWPIQFFTKPEGDFQYTKLVTVLTDLNTFSSGETFVLAMLQNNNNVKTICDVTGVALADAVHTVSWIKEVLMLFAVNKTALSAGAGFSETSISQK